jgi:hypothetical protein
MNAERRVAGEVTFQVTGEDCVTLYRDCLRDRFGGSLGGPDAKILGALLLICLILWAIDTMAPRLSFDHNGASWLPFVIAALAWYCFCRAYSYLRAPQLARRLFRQRASYQRPLSYGWSGDGLSFRTAHTTGRIPWADLYRWHAGEHNFLFFTDEQMIYFIPRTALTEEQAKDLEATVIASGAPLRPDLKTS